MSEAESTEYRSVGMMQHLAHDWVHGRMPRGDARGIVKERHALAAVNQLFVIIDREVFEQRMSGGRAMFAQAMLMVLREYVTPLPELEDYGGSLSTDLRDLTDALATTF